MVKEIKLEYEITLVMLMGQVLRVSTKRFVQNSHTHGLEISLDQWLVLGPVWKNDGISQKDISEYCGKDKTSVTKIIDTLEKKNLVVRVTDQLDHRVKRVVLSQKGRELFVSALPVMAQTRDELRSGISDKEIEALKSILNKIHKNLNDIQ